MTDQFRRGLTCIFAGVNRPECRPVWSRETDAPYQLAIAALARYVQPTTLGDVGKVFWADFNFCDWFSFGWRDIMGLCDSAGGTRPTALLRWFANLNVANAQSPQ